MFPIHLHRFILMVSLLLLAFSCAKKSHPTSGQTDVGSICVMLEVKPTNSMSKQSRCAATVWDRVIAKVSGSGMDDQKDSMSTGTGVSLDTLVVSGIYYGSNRSVTVWSVNSSTGDTIHAPVSQSGIVVNTAETTNVSVTLSPSKGSILLSFWDIETGIDTVVAVFTTGSGTFRDTCEVTSGRALLSLDYIPDGATGTLTIEAYKAGSKITDYDYSKSLTFSATTDSTVAATWQAKFGSISLCITVEAPGGFLVAGAMDTAEAMRDMDSVEQGPIYFSEFLSTSNGEEFLEIHNPGTDSAKYDSLFLGINNNSTWYKLYDVKIPPDGFYVITVDDIAYKDTMITALASKIVGTGNSFWLRQATDSLLIDWVYFPGTSFDTQLAWPNVGTTTDSTLVLSALPDVGVRHNNYGKNWVTGQTAYTASDSETKYGTPGSAGR